MSNMHRLIDGLKAKINNMHLEKKIFLSVSCVEIVLIGLVFLLGLRIVTNKYDDLLYENIKNSSSLMVNELGNRINEIDTMSNVVRSDQTIQSILDELKNPPTTNASHYSAEIYAALERYYLDYKAPYVSYAAIACPRFVAYTRETINAYADEALKTSIIEYATKADGSGIWIHYPEQKDNLYYAKEIKKIQHMRFDNLGTFFVCLNMDKLFSEISHLSHEYENSCWILHDSNQVIYCSDSIQKENAEKLIGFTSSYTIEQMDGKTYFCVSGKTNMKDWNYIHLIPYDDILKAKQLTVLNYILILLAGIVLSFLILHLIIRKTTRHLDILVSRMEQFAKNSNELPYSNYHYQDRKDEIGILHVQFEKMAMEIQNLIDEKYKQELLTKEAQLRSLEAQMNPHFIYNTLESINWRAKAIKEKEISDIAEALGHFLRMTVSNNQNTFTLENELSIVNSYMTIQKIRYDSRLVYTQNIPEKYLNAVIPKLSIQPLLENSVHYALEQITEECYISLSCELRDNLLYIFTRNTGSEFPADLLTKLKNHEIQESGLGIALINIDNRIKLLFGSEFGLTFYNEGEEAVALMTIPYRPIS